MGTYSDYIKKKNSSKQDDSVSQNTSNQKSSYSDYIKRTSSAGVKDPIQRYTENRVNNQLPDYYDSIYRNNKRQVATYNLSQEAIPKQQDMNTGRFVGYDNMTAAQIKEVLDGNVRTIYGDGSGQRAQEQATNDYYSQLFSNANVAPSQPSLYSASTDLERANIGSAQQLPNLETPELQQVYSQTPMDSDKETYLNRLYYNKSQEEAYNSLTPEQLSLYDQYTQLSDQARLIRASEASGRGSQSLQNLNSASDMSAQASAIAEQLEAQGIDIGQLNDYQQRLESAELQSGLEESAQYMAQEHPIISSIASVASNALAPLDLIPALGDVIRGVPIDQNNMIFTNFRDEMRGAVSEEIDNDALRFLYGTGMSIADMALLLPMGQAALPIMGTTMTTSTIKDVTERGGSTEQALYSGILAGVFETLSEKIPLDNLFRMKDITGMKSLLTQILKQSAIEGSEELVTELANEATDIFMNGGYSQYSQAVEEYMNNGMSEDEAKNQYFKDLSIRAVEATLGGALSGGVFGTAGNVIQYVGQREQRRAQGSNTATNNVNAEVSAPTVQSPSMETTQRETGTSEPQITLKNQEISHFTGRNTVKLTSGEEVSLDQVDFSNSSSALYANANVQDSVGLSNAYVHNYDSKIPASTYQSAFSNIKNKVVVNDMTYEQVKNSLKNNADVSLLSETQIKNIYDASVHYAEELHALNTSEEQVSAVKALAKAVGVNVVFENLDGVNGKFQDGTVYISTKTNNPALSVFAHEMTHRMKQTNSELYTQFSNIVLGYMQNERSGEYQKLVEHYKKNSAYFKNQSIIDEEIVCNAAQDFFTDKEAIEKLISENRSLAEKIFDFLKDILENITTLYKKQKASSAESRILKESKEAYEQAIEIWTEALSSESDTTNSNTTNNTDVETSESTENQDIRYSLKDVDEFLDLEEEYANMDFSDSAKLLESAFDSMKPTNINKQAIRNITNTLLKRYNSEYNFADFSENVEKVFTYLYNAEDIVYEDFLKIANEVMKPVIEQSTKKDPFLEENYKAFTRFIRNTPIRLSDAQKSELSYYFDNYENFRRKTFGKIRLKNDGIELEALWPEICESSGYYLNLDTNSQDMAMELYDALEAMKPAVENVYGMNTQEVTYDATLDLLQLYFGAQSDEKVKQASDKLKKLMEKKRKQYAEDYQQRLAQIRQEESAKKKELRTQYRERADDRINRLKAKQNDSRARQMQRKRETDIRNKIRGVVKVLDQKLRRPTKGSHVPQTLVRCVCDVLGSIDLDTGRSAALSERMRDLNEQYSRMKDRPEFDFEYDSNTAQEIARLSDLFRDRSIAKLNEEELYQVYDVCNRIKHMVINETKLIITSNKEQESATIYDTALSVQKEVDSTKGSSDNLIGRGKTKYAFKALSPIRFFRRISGYSQTKVLESLAEGLNEGQHEEMRIKQHVAEIFDSVTRGKENQENLRQLLGDRNTDLIDSPYGKITRGMRLSIAMHMMNPQNLRHAIIGGFTVPTRKAYSRGDFQTAYARGNTIRLFEKERIDAVLRSDSEIEYNKLRAEAIEKLNEMMKDMSEYEKKYLECAKELFHKYTGEQLNKTTLELRGYEIANETNYFPIVTDSSYLKKEFEALKHDATLEGMGMLKARVNASNPILLEDITSVVDRTTNRVARYCGMAIPVRNFQKVYNTTFEGWSGSVQSTIKKKWGVDASKYIENLMADLQGARSTTRGLFDKIQGNFAQATLTLNPSVAMKQAASYPTAAAVVGWESVGKAFRRGGKNNRFISRANMELINKWSPLLWYRNQGNSTQEIGDIKSRKSMSQHLPMLTNWIQKIDTMTVGRLWSAAEYYVKDHYKNLEVGTDAYYEQVATWFNKIVEESQPNYTAMQRADILRDPNKLTRALFMFKTQPMQNFNIVYDAYMEMRTNNTKESRAQFARAVSSQIVAAAVFTAMTLASKALLHRMDAYRDDDDELNMESILETMLNDLLSCMSGSLILGSELYNVINSMLTGNRYYSIEVSSVGVIADILSDVVNLSSMCNKFVDGEKSLEEVGTEFKDTALDICIAFGIPAENVEKILNGLWLHGIDISKGKPGSFDAGSSVSYFDKMYEAIENGDIDYYNELREKAKAGYKAETAEQTVDSNMKKFLAENDLRIQEAAEARNAGDIETYSEIVEEMVDNGWEKEIITGAVTRAQNILDKENEDEDEEDDEEEEEKLKSIYSYSDVTHSIEMGYTSAAQTAITDIYNTALENGKDEDKARSTIKSQLTKHFKEVYKTASTKQRENIRKYLMTIVVGKKNLYKYADFSDWLK